MNADLVKSCSARHGYKKADICIAQRLARILYQMWRNKEDFDLGKRNVKATRKVRTKTVYYEIKPLRKAEAAA